MQNNLRKLRGNISLEKLSELTGISAQQLNRLEKGQRRYNSDNLAEISKALNCKPEDIISTDLDLASPLSTTYSSNGYEEKKMAKYIASIAIDSIIIAQELVKEGLLAIEDMKRIAIEGANEVIQNNHKKITRGLLTHIIEQEK